MAAKFGTATGSVETVKPTLVAPAGRGSTAETLAKTLLVLAPAADPAGAGALSWMVPAEEPPPTRDFGSRATGNGGLVAQASLNLNLSAGWLRQPSAHSSRKVQAPFIPLQVGATKHS